MAREKTRSIAEIEAARKKRLIANKTVVKEIKIPLRTMSYADYPGWQKILWDFGKFDMEDVLCESTLEEYEQRQKMLERLCAYEAKHGRAHDIVRDGKHEKDAALFWQLFFNDNRISW
jgi:hypothetical protein